MDPEKSTDAACRYLKDLYNMFHDWELALLQHLGDGCGHRQRRCGRPLAPRRAPHRHPDHAAEGVEDPAGARGERVMNQC